MTLTRMILAFIVSPVAYILIYMTTLVVFLHFREHEEVSGVVFYMPTYFLYVLVSIPIFLLIRRFYGWTFLSCSVAALLVVIVTEALSFTSRAEQPFTPYTLWLLGAVAALVYGGVFWLLVPPDFRGETVT